LLLSRVTGLGLSFNFTHNSFAQTQHARRSVHRRIFPPIFRNQDVALQLPYIEQTTPIFVRMSATCTTLAQNELSVLQPPSNLAPEAQNAQ
jgi:hypothetical protein